MTRETRRDRVEVLLPMPNGAGVIGELLSDPQWPDSIGKVRLIGGKIERGELPEEAAVRELMEEYGLEIQVDDLQPVQTYDGPRGQVVRLSYSKAQLDWLGRVDDTGTGRLVVSPTVPQPWY